MLDSNFTQQRVFIVGDDSLFDEGVTDMLAQRTDFLVSHVTFSDDFAFMDTVRQDLPDVMLICESDSLDPVRILDLVSSHTIAMGLLVVVIRLYNNVVDIYERPIIVGGKMYFTSQQIIATTGNDLLNTIKEKI